MPETPGEITRLLQAIQAGDRAAESQFLERVYPDLHRLAAHYLHQERPDHTLQASALVNEVYLRLFHGGGIDWQNRAHFFAVAAQSMRRILVSYARAKRASKRDGQRNRLELTDALAISDDRLDEVLAIDEALTSLAGLDARQSRIVEMRFFGGMTEDEVAQVLGIATRTVNRDWLMARAWLRAYLNDHDPDANPPTSPA